MSQGEKALGLWRMALGWAIGLGNLSRPRGRECLRTSHQTLHTVIDSVPGRRGVQSSTARNGGNPMFRHSTRRLQLGTTLLLALIIAGCSSSDEGGGAPAAVADTGSGGDEATGEFVLKQTFDMGIEVTSPVFNRIRRIPKSYVCKGQPPKPGQSFEQNAATKYANRENISPPLEWTGIPDGTQSIGPAHGLRSDRPRTGPGRALGPLADLEPTSGHREPARAGCNHHEVGCLRS